MTLPATTLPPYHPDQPEPTLHAWALADIPTTEEDAIPASEVLPPPAASDVFPRIILGCAPFGYGIYADKSVVEGVEPVRLVRAALRAGVNAFDTGESASTSTRTSAASASGLREVVHDTLGLWGMGEELSTFPLPPAPTEPHTGLRSR